MTRPTFHSGFIVMSRAIWQTRYSSSSPMLFSWPQICRTESAAVYTIIFREPDASSCPASSVKISVPLAALLPMTSWPVRRSSSSISAWGKPVFVNVTNGFSVRSPIISQWPVVVSLPTERSLRAHR